MEKLYKSELAIINKFKDSYSCHYPLLKPMLKGELASEIYVDSFSHPSAMFVFGDNNWCYSLGDFDSSKLQIKVIELIENNILKNEKPIFWFGISKATSEMLNQIKDISLNHYPRFNFTFTGCDIQIKKVDSSINVEVITAENIESFIKYNPEFNQFWDSEESFLQSGVGFIAKSDNQIVGHAFSASVCNQEVEIDLMTLETYRGKGISTHLTTTLINECEKRNLIPKWDCSISNKASIRLAEKHGFEVEKEYSFAYIERRK